MILPRGPGAAQRGGVQAGFRRQPGGQRAACCGRARGAAAGGCAEFRLKQRNGRSRRGGTSLRHQDFRQGAVLAGLELHMGLVRLNVGQMVADSYEVPCFFEPSQDGAFAHGVGQAGHFNGNSHGGEC
ncbi:hypothetical protein SI90_12030 [Akkermansia muciniphila]|nr:hypothetical protein SI90_12030 [Akkermansia muciniphila]